MASSIRPSILSLLISSRVSSIPSTSLHDRVRAGAAPINESTWSWGRQRPLARGLPGVPVRDALNWSAGGRPERLAVRVADRNKSDRHRIVRDPELGADQAFDV